MPNANLPHVNTNLFSWTMLSGLTRECERRAIKLVPHASEGDLSAPEIIAGARPAAPMALSLCTITRRA
ncbi:hypothetical protein V6L77_09350 [Pannonibacter sp. Pt2-lr]